MQNLIQINQEILFRVLGAILILLAGFILAIIVKKIIRNFLNKIKLNQVMERLGWKEAFSKVGIELNIVLIFEKIVKWMILILFSVFTFEVLGLPRFSQFLEKIVDYFPNVIVASLIFIATLYLVDFTYRVFFVTVKKTDEKTEFNYSRFFGIGIRRIIWILATLAILYQLKIVPNLILSVFLAILALIVLAGGISFGLGGKDIAKKILDEWREKLP